MMSKDYDDDDTTTEEILDMHWDKGPLAQARKNLNVLCSGMLLQKSLRMMIDEIQVLEDIISDDTVSIVDKVSAKQTLAILNKTWAALVDQFGHTS